MLVSTVNTLCIRIVALPVEVDTANTNASAISTPIVADKWLRV